VTRLPLIGSFVVSNRFRFQGVKSSRQSIIIESGYSGIGKLSNWLYSNLVDLGYLGTLWGVGATIKGIIYNTNRLGPSYITNINYIDNDYFLILIDYSATTAREEELILTSLQVRVGACDEGTHYCTHLVYRLPPSPYPTNLTT
jgi:hypothetical protein